MMSTASVASALPGETVGVMTGELLPENRVMESLSDHQATSSLSHAPAHKCPCPTPAAHHSP